MRIKLAILAAVTMLAASCQAQMPNHAGTIDDPQTPAQNLILIDYSVSWIEVEPGRPPLLCIITYQGGTSCNWEEYNKSK